LDWEHPSSPEQGEDYVALMQNLRCHLPRPHHLLTTALPVGEYVLKHINLRFLSISIDLLNLMTYDFAGSWSDGQSGHHAQLTAPALPHNAYAKKSGKSAVEYVLAQGVTAKQILLGVPVYGRSFHGIEGPGQRFSKCGGQDGTWLYSELPRPGTTEMVDWEVGGACCLGGGEWVSYDSVDTVRMKAEYVKSVGIGGLFYWTGAGDKTGDESLIASGWKEFRGT
jgi:chitinase